MASDDRRRGSSKVLRFAVSGALLLAPAASGCGGSDADDEIHVNEPAPEELETVNEPAPETEPETEPETDEPPSVETTDEEAPQPTVNEPADPE